MLSQQSTYAYQMAAASGATESGLLQLVYLHLAQDLLRAADAVRENSVEGRCTASKHALLLLAHAESWVDAADRTDLGVSLRTYYQVVRASILQTQSDPSAVAFEQIAKLVLDTRAAWQQKEAMMCASDPTTVTLLEATGEISFRA